METLKKEGYLSLNGVGYLFGSSPETITVITSSEPKRCRRGKYYVVKIKEVTEREGIKSVEFDREWLDEWPVDIPNPNPEEDKHNSFFSWIERVFN